MHEYITANRMCDFIIINKLFGQKVSSLNTFRAKISTSSYEYSIAIPVGHVYVYHDDP